MENLIPSRKKMYDRLDEHFDVIIIGGGITGANVLRDAALRGLSVCLIEKGDFAAGSSSITSRMIHGGVRYLQNYEFGLVREAALERKVYVDLAPQLAEVMNFIVPLYKWNPEPLFMLRLGLIAYDLLAIPKRIGRHKILNKKKIVDRFPLLENDDITGGAMYQDVKTDDARLTLINVLSGVAAGGVALNYTEAIEWEDEGDEVEVEIKDKLTGKKYEIKGDTLILCAGPWTEIVENLGDDFEGKAKVRTTRGTHILLDMDIGQEYAALLINDDKRPIFIIPRINGKVLAGTTDVDFTGSPDDVVPTREDVEYILEACNKIFPSITFEPKDVLSAFAGVRPLVQKKGVKEGKVSRKHSIFVDGSIITLVGGKLTTARVMAKQAINKALKILMRSKREYLCVTNKIPLFGGDILDWSQYYDENKKRLIEKYELSDTTADMLIRWYGSELELFENMLDEVGTSKFMENQPWLEAQLVFSCRVELAQHPIDFLRRRTPIMLERDNGEPILDRVIEIMASELDWDEKYMVKMREETMKFINKRIRVDLS